MSLGVDEPLTDDISHLSARLPLEFDLVAEPMELTGQDLAILIRRMGSAKDVARLIGASEAFVRQNATKGLN